MKSLAPLFLLFLSITAFSQVGKVKGKVIDSNSAQPLPFASIFINNTTLGTEAKEDGTFVLKNIPFGEHDLVVSFVGYQSYQTRVVVKDTSARLLQVRLVPVQLKDVTVTATRDEVWEKQLAKFKRSFLGVSGKNELVIIRNPYGLDFTDDEKTFTAKSSSVLEIDNYQLGYHVMYELKNFVMTPALFSITGYVSFKELSTPDPQTQVRWNENRRKAYEGSSRHLFKTLIDGKLAGSGFELYTDIKDNSGHTNIFLQNLDRTIKKLEPSAFVVDSTSTKGVYKIKLPKRLEAHYMNKSASTRIYKDIAHPVSSIEVSGGVLQLTREGIVINYPMVVMAGDMSEPRIADLLPYDYRVNIKPVTTPPEIEKKETAKLSSLMEKPYIHTDKSCYYANDQIFFKAYVNYGNVLFKDSLSHVLHVELISPAKTIVASKIFPLWDGYVEGSFPISQLYPKGDYAIRAYTRWQLNFDHRLVFQRSIKILDANEVAASSEKVFLTETGVVIRTDKESYHPREKIELSVEAFDSTEHAIPANLSIAVTDVQQVAKAVNEKNILQEFPITRADTSSLPEALHYRPQVGIEIHGTFTSKKGKQEEGIISVIEKKSGGALTIKSEKNGEFFVEGFQFNDSSQIVIQAKGLRDQKPGKVTLDTTSVIPEVATVTPLIFPVQERSKNRSYRYWEPPPVDNVRTLKEVTIESTRLESQHQVDAVKRMANYSLSGDMLRSIRANNVALTLQGRVPSLRFRPYFDGMTMIEIVTIDQSRYRGPSIGHNLPSGNSGGGSSSSSGGGGGSSSAGGAGGSSKNAPTPKVYGASQEALVLIDGVQVNYQAGDGARALRQLRADEIEYIDIYTSHGYGAYGFLGNNGVISVRRRNPEQFATAIDRTQVNVFNVFGYSTPATFASPDYSKPNAEDKADYRSTIYWNPAVITTTGASTVSFYAADNATMYRIVIEGVTNDGTPVRGEKIIEIKPAQ